MGDRFWTYTSCWNIFGLGISNLYCIFSLANCKSKTLKLGTEKLVLKNLDVTKLFLQTLRFGFRCICRANQRSGFYMIGAYVMLQIKSTKTPIAKLIFVKIHFVIIVLWETLMVSLNKKFDFKLQLHNVVLWHIFVSARFFIIIFSLFSLFSFVLNKQCAL